jgi:outer membrane immunogenic protein
MLKRAFVNMAAAGALLCAGLAAQAADISTQMPTKAPAFAPVPFFNWSGVYFGVNGGGGWGTSSHTDNNFGHATGDFGIGGGLIGGTLGFNYQVGPWVWGLVGDLDWVPGVLDRQIRSLEELPSSFRAGAPQAL